MLYSGRRKNPREHAYKRYIQNTEKNKQNLVTSASTVTSSVPSGTVNKKEVKSSQVPSTATTATAATAATAATTATAATAATTATAPAVASHASVPSVPSRTVESPQVTPRTIIKSDQDISILLNTIESKINKLLECVNLNK